MAPNNRDGGIGDVLVSPQAAMQLPLAPVRSKTQLGTSTNKRKRCQDSTLTGTEAGPSVCIEGRLRQIERQSALSDQLSVQPHWYESTLRLDPQEFLFPRLQRSHWKRLSRPAQEQVAVALQNLWRTRLETTNQSTARQTTGTTHASLQFTGISCQSPLFFCQKTKLQYVLVMGGSYTTGLSSTLRDSLHQQLLTFYQLESLHGLPTALSTRTCLPWSSQYVQDRLSVLNDLLYIREPECTLTMVKPFLLAATPCSVADSGVVVSKSALSDSTRARLPYETEWEYAARGGGWEMLFPYKHQLEDNHRSCKENESRNATGIYGLDGPAEICQAGSPPSKTSTSPPSDVSLVARAGRDVWSLLAARRRFPSSGSLQSTAIRWALDVVPVTNHNSMDAS